MGFPVRKQQLDFRMKRNDRSSSKKKGLEGNISYREKAGRISIKTCAEGVIPNFFLIQMQDIGNTVHEGLMNNSENLYKERSVGYCLKKRIAMVDLHSVTNLW